MVLEPAAAQPVAAFEMADPSLAAGPVLRQPPLGSSAAWLLTTGDERPLGSQALQRLARGTDVEPAIERDLSRCDPEALQFRDRVEQQRVLGRVPDLWGIRRAASGCGGGVGTATAISGWTTRT